jgi:predicted metalloprotease with PDZ domain
MKQLVLLLFFPAILCAAEPLSFSIKPMTVNEKPVLQVTVVFDGAEKGISYLNYKNDQFGEPNQMAFLNLPTQLPGITVSKEPASDRLVVRHTPNARVTVTYEVRDLQEEAKQGFYQYCCYKPIIHSDYFQVQSGHLLAAPSHYWDSPNDVLPVKLTWEKFPANWTIHNSFGPDTQQNVALTNKQFGSAVFVGGDFRRFKFDVKGQPIYFLTRGKWDHFKDDSLTSLLRRTIEGHRAFWQDFSDSIYTVTFLPINDAPYSDRNYSVSLGGSGLTNSFMSFATDNPGVQYNSIRYIYVHELMHRWIGDKIENANEEKQYWFSEGFTEYFTLKNSLRYGFIDAEEFIRELNDNFAIQHYSSPKRTMPNDSMTYENFWNGGKNWEKLPYRRGCLYAFYLDNLIREKSGGSKNLDVFMRELLRLVSAKPTQKLDHPFFLKTLSTFLGKSCKKDFKRFIEKGELIDFQKTVLPLGLNLNVRDVTMRYGPNPETITSTEVYKNVPVFSRDPNVSWKDIQNALLR